MKHGTPEDLKSALVATGDYDAAFCDEACLSRYLRARSGCVEKAAAMLRETVKWRKEHGVDAMTAAEFADCQYMREGWVYVAGNDAQGRAVVVLRKRKDKIPLSAATAYVRYFTFMLETAVRSMKDGAEQWVWLLDLAEYSPSNAPHPGVTLQVLQLLANHYPERLAKAYFINAPSIFSIFFKMMSPFVDAVTRSKVEFVSTRDYTDPAPSSSGGSSTWGSWASSMFHRAASHSHAAPREQQQQQQQAADAAVVVEDTAAAKAPVGPAGGTFHPFVPFWAKPHDYASHQAHLAAVGWS